VPSLSHHLPVAWVAEVVEGTPIGVVLGTVEETVEGGEVVCTVVLVVVF